MFSDRDTDLGLGSPLARTTHHHREATDLTSPPCYAAAMIHDLIMAFLVACTAVIASEVLTRIWDYF
jgi:hypothetical protein